MCIVVSPLVVFTLAGVCMCMGVALQLSRFLCEQCGQVKCTVCPTINNNTNTRPISIDDTTHR